MSKTEISVIVPCYNQAEYLSECLDSVLHQTYNYWECIIVNDSSSDNTEEVALEFCTKDIRFKYISKENGGLSSARNAGIDVSIGFYILPLDADDKIGSRYLQDALDIFKNNKHTTLVYCNAEFFGNQIGKWDLPEYSFRTLLTQNMIFCSAIFRKLDFKKCGEYDVDFKKGWEDWDLWIRLLKGGGEVLKIESNQFYYRRKTQSMVQGLAEDNEAQREILNKMYFKYFDLYSKNFPTPITAFGVIEDLSNELKILKEESKKSLDRAYNSKSYRVGNTLIRSLSKFFIKFRN